mmetsp:Transcript_1502/g.2131  ORF Transcript_1502/g.2131 Transcript_1502/m.2131 type:complete len:83 (-) Transcript_1502:310-558(-)
MVRTLPCVTPHMNLQLSSLAKPLETLGTVEWEFLSMYQHMHLKLVTVSKCAITNRTCKSCEAVNLFDMTLKPLRVFIAFVTH